MYNKKHIYVFDFDGTIIDGDSLFLFLRFVFGLKKMFLGIFILSPFILAYKLKLISNHTAKEKIFMHFFSGVKEGVFNEWCEKFKGILDKKVNGCLVKYLFQREYRRIIVSASPELWILPWAKRYGIEVVATKLEIINGCLTGKIIGKNCYGNEKTQRLVSIINHRDDYDIIGFGDSTADESILRFCDQAYFVKCNSLKQYV